MTMTLAAFIMYVIANITGLLLYWFFNQRDSEKEAISEEEILKRRSRLKAQPSLFQVIGLQDYSPKYFYAIEDHFQTFKEVGRACKRAGLEKCGLIIGVDFTASNEWQGRKTFSGNCLHRVVSGKIYNPYQKVISIIGQTLEPFDDDNFIPAYGFGDTSTNATDVFSFIKDGSPCSGVMDVLKKYNEIATKITLSGPTNFAPLIYKAIDIVKEKQSFHILIIIADGQVTEEEPTVEAIVEASNHPMSIVVIGVGDGPWDIMKDFDDHLPRRRFDNFQFVNYHQVTSKCKHPDTAFALHAMMEVPDQYKAIKSLGYLKNDYSNSTGYLETHLS